MNVEINEESYKVYRMQVLHLEMKIFMNIWSDVFIIRVYMGDFHSIGYTIVIP